MIVAWVCKANVQASQAEAGAAAGVEGRGAPPPNVGDATSLGTYVMIALCPKPNVIV